MRIVQLNCVFGNGSTGKIVEAIFDYCLRCGDDPHALYGYGPTSSRPGTVRVIPPAVRKAQSLRSRITGYPYGGCIWGTTKTIHELQKLKPDIVHIHCFNAYIANIYTVLQYLKESRIPTVITNHAEFMYTGGCTHAIECKKWLDGCGGCKRIGKEHPISWFFDRTADEWKRLQKAYAGFDRLTICCVSDWVRSRAARSPFFQQYEVVTVLNGLDTAVFKKRDDEDSRNRFGLPEGPKIVLHVTPGFGSAIKGGKHVLEMARRMPDVVFVVAGDHGGSSTDLANVRFVGRVDDQELLAELYSLADVCLLTSEKETFSMVTAESLCCGTPVVGFEAGGPESIAIEEYSSFVSSGDDDALEKGLRGFLGASVDSGALAQNAQNLYDQQKMCERYRSIYLDMLCSQMR